MNFNTRIRIRERSRIESIGINDEDDEEDEDDDENNDTNNNKKDNLIKKENEMVNMEGNDNDK